MDFLKLPYPHDFGVVMINEEKMAFSMTVVALLLIAIMATSVLASKMVLVNSASLAKNKTVSTQLRTNAFCLVPADFALGPIAA